MSNGRGGKECTLSVGAQTYIRELARNHVYGHTPTVSTKEMAKGIIVEPESIQLVNTVLFTSLTKNEQRLENAWLTGTPDIVAPERIHDIKSSWSLATFPVVAAEGQDALYEWQLRGYMMLADRDHAELDYCLVDTPDELIGFEDEGAHRVSHIDPALRVTRVPVERDPALEDKIEAKVEAARAYYLQAVEEIYAQHN